MYKHPHECERCGETIYRLPDYGNGSPTEKQQIMSDAVAKSPNRCHSFALNPIDAFGENERGYKPREPKKKQCDGQMRLE